MLGLFTKEAATTSLTGTLHRSGLAGGSVGSALSSIGGGVGDVMRGLFTPLWEIGNFAKSFGFGGDYWGNSTVDPQSNQERILLTGQGGGYDDASQQGGGDTGVNQEPIAGQPNIKIPKSLTGFTFYERPSIASYGISDVNVNWGSGTSAMLPLGREAIQHYQSIGVPVSPVGSPVVETGGGSNTSTGMGASSGSNNPLGAAQAAGYSLGAA